MSGMFIVLQPITGEIFTTQKPQATTVSDRSWNKLFSFCLRIQTTLLGM